MTERLLCRVFTTFGLHLLIHHPFLLISLILFSSAKWFSLMPSSGEEITILHNLSTRDLIRDNPSSLSIPLFFCSPSHFHSPLLSVWQYLVRGVILLLNKNADCQVTSCIYYFHPLAVCAWHMSDTLSGDCRWQSDLLPFSQASKPASPEGLR